MRLRKSYYRLTVRGFLTPEDRNLVAEETGKTVVEVEFVYSEIVRTYVAYPQELRRTPQIIDTSAPPQTASTIHIPSVDDQESVRRDTLLALHSWNLPENKQEEIVKKVNSECQRHFSNARKYFPGSGVKVLVFLHVLTNKFWDYHEYARTIERVMDNNNNNNKPVPATKSSIEALERVVFDSLASSEDCIICMDEIEIGFEAIRMPCSHLYHHDCIVKWLQNSHVCPLCRYEMRT